ncbi:MAG: phosphoribosylformylglycinamidine synthase subunit PurQ, partial [Clostridia bacterium]|nr:phosphoribosylformylglycinamidine synthase subunit PurQ [Clostridia bacterium]
RPEYDADGLPVAESLLALYDKVAALTKAGKVLAAYTPTYGGVAEAVMKMCFGNGVGFKYSDKVSIEDIFGYSYGSFVLELADGAEADGIILGETTAKNSIVFGNEAVDLDTLYKDYESVLEGVYPTNAEEAKSEIPAFSYEGKSAPAVIKCAKPRVLIPVFPGTNCEYDSAKAFMRAGAETEIFVVKNLSAEKVAESVDSFVKKIKDSQIIFVPGGFSGGDEPDGSGKFITAFFRNEAIKNEVNELLKNRDGLMCGICNGFQALIKLGLVPYGEIIDTDENCPTLTFNSIGRHQSRIVRTRIASNNSPWLSEVKVGDVYSVPISHGEGRFFASDELISKLAANGQIATQYVDLEGKPTSNILYNPNNSCYAIEGITSPDGHVFGKMGHTERYNDGLYKNVEGNYDMKIFESAVKYFK